MAQKPSEDEVAVISHMSDGLQSFDGGMFQGHIATTLKVNKESQAYECMFLFLFSITELFSDSSYSEESEYESSDFDSSDSFSSDSFEDSSSSNLSPEDEEAIEEEDDRSSGCIVISSDEESMELDPSLNSAAPLTPGAQLDLCLQDWSDPFQTGDREENQCTDCQQDTQDFDALMELQTRASHDLQPPSPLGHPGYMSYTI